MVYLPSHHASLDPLSEDDASYLTHTPIENLRDVIYDSAKLEKTARAEEFSAIKRAINKNAIVIADAPNYIKGFRYQLHCEAKSARTRSIVVHCASREDECRSWNDARLRAWGLPASADAADSNAPGNMTAPGSKIGRDVQGELQPESHTALYGDRVLDESAASRSRSSSTGAALSDEDEGSPTKSKLAHDTMTLKSLSISDRVDKGSRHETQRSEQSPTIPKGNGHTSQPQSQSIPPHPKASLPYSPSSFQSLFMRYEPPSPFTRWDTPLFTIPSTDAHPPYDQIWEALFPAPVKNTSKNAKMLERHEQERIQRAQAEAETQAQSQSQNTAPASNTPAGSVASVKQNTATIIPTAFAPNALQLLESTTGEVTKFVLASARQAGVADTGEEATLRIIISVDGEDVELEIEKAEGVKVSQPKLQQLRRKYTQIQRGAIAHKQKHTQGRENVAKDFCCFLENEFRGEGNG